MKQILLLTLASSFIFTGCASTTNGLQKATARNIQSDYMSTEIEISNVERQAMNVDWKAKTPDGKVFRCSADDMVREVKCKQ